MPDTLLEGNPEVLAVYVNGTLYLCYRYWEISVFSGMTSANSQYHSIRKISVSVVVGKIQY